MAVTRAFGDPDLTPGSFSAFSKQEISADAATKAIAQLETVPPLLVSDHPEISHCGLAVAS
jgi:hypothetical protein